MAVDVVGSQNEPPKGFTGIKAEFNIMKERAAALLSIKKRAKERKAKENSLQSYNVHTKRK